LISLNVETSAILKPKITKLSLKRQLLSIKGLKDLTYSIDNMKFDSEWTKLVPELALSNPNQIMNDIPYQKGYIFVYYLEEKVGGGN